MARTKGATGRLKKAPADIQFKRLDGFKKLIAYNYWINIESKGEKGWNINKAGSVDHWRQSEFIQEGVPKTSFYHLGKVRKLVLLDNYFLFFLIIPVLTA